MSVIKEIYRSKSFDRSYNSIRRIGHGDLYTISLESYHPDDLGTKRPAFLFCGDETKDGIIQYIEDCGKFIMGSHSYVRNGNKTVTQQTALQQVLAALYYGYDPSMAKLLDVGRKVYRPITIRADVTGRDGHKVSTAKLHRFLQTHTVYPLTPDALTLNSQSYAKGIHANGLLFDGRLTVGNQEFFFPHSNTANCGYGTSHDFLELLDEIKGWHLGGSGAECDLEGQKNTHLALPHLVALYWGGELDEVLQLYKAGGVPVQKVLSTANDIKTRKAKQGLVVDHLSESKSYNMPHALVWMSLSANSAFLNTRTAIAEPYYFHMAHDFRHGAVKVVCGIQGEQEYRFIFDDSDLTKPAQNKRAPLPNDEVCQCLECFRAFKAKAPTTTDREHHNILTKSINRQMDLLRDGGRPYSDPTEDVADAPIESFARYEDGVFDKQ